MGAEILWLGWLFFLRVGKSDLRSSFATQQKKPTEPEIAAYTRKWLLNKI
jgi:hypothetical protein